MSGFHYVTCRINDLRVFVYLKDLMNVSHVTPIVKNITKSRQLVFILPSCIIKDIFLRNNFRNKIMKNRGQNFITTFYIHYRMESIKIVFFMRFVY